MISLFLDSSASYMIVGVYQDLKQLYLTVEKNDNHLSERLLPAIRKAFDSLSLSVHQIDRIYVANGPGSFTGVRIGVAVAKTLAWALKKEIIPISELELMASTSEEKQCIALIDARRNFVYAGIYDKNLNSIMKDQYIALDTLLEKNDENTILVSGDTFEFDTILPDFKIEKVIEKHKNDTPINPHELKPNYLKRTEAEEKNDL